MGEQGQPAPTDSSQQDAAHEQDAAADLFGAVSVPQNSTKSVFGDSDDDDAEAVALAEPQSKKFVFGDSDDDDAEAVALSEPSALEALDETNNLEEHEFEL